MGFIQRLFLYIAMVSLVLVVIGLFKPWVVLWWEDHQNRRKVFMLYGTVLLISYALYWVLRIINY